ncbi:MAG: hypothetical protein AB8G05_26600 [Oligoflexales bacterium]
MKILNFLICSVLFTVGFITHGKTQNALIVVDAQKGFAEEQKLVIEGIEGEQVHGLVVDEAEKIIEPINSLITGLAQEQEGLTLVYSGDFHPTDHLGFFQMHEEGTCDIGKPMKVPDHSKESQQWPFHCVQGTSGCDFITGLKVPASVTDNLAIGFVQKGTRPGIESYSCLVDEDGLENTIASSFQDATQEKTYTSVNLDGSPVEARTSTMDYLAANVDFERTSRVIVTGLALDVCVKKTAESLHNKLKARGLSDNVEIIVPLDGTKHAIDKQETISELKKLGIKFVDRAEDLLP